MNLHFNQLNPQQSKTWFLLSFIVTECRIRRYLKPRGKYKIPCQVTVLLKVVAFFVWILWRPPRLEVPAMEKWWGNAEGVNRQWWSKTAKKVARFDDVTYQRFQQGKKIRGPGCPITRCVTCGVRWKSTNIQSLKTWRKETGISGGQTPWSILRSPVRVNMTARFLPGSLRRLFCSWSSRVRRSVILIILYEVKWSLLVNHRIRTDLIGCSPLLWVSVAVLQHHTVYYSVSVICEPQHTIYIKKKTHREPPIRNVI